MAKLTKILSALVILIALGLGRPALALEKGDPLAGCGNPDFTGVFVAMMPSEHAEVFAEIYQEAPDAVVDTEGALGVVLWEFEEDPMVVVGFLWPKEGWPSDVCVWGGLAYSNKGEMVRVLLPELARRLENSEL